MNEENQRRRTRRRERPVKKKKGRILAICLAALVLAGVVYGVHTWADYSGSFQSSAEVTVKIPSGSSGRQIAAQLAEDGIISHKTVFYYYMRMTGAGAGLKPGSYVLRSDMSYAEIVEALSAGSEREDVARVTFPEGLSLREIADLLEAEVEYDQVYQLLEQAHRAEEEPREWFERRIAGACRRAGGCR